MTIYLIITKEQLMELQNSSFFPSLTDLSIEQIEELKQATDIELKQKLVKKATSGVLQTLLQNSSPIVPMHERFFSYYFPSKIKGKYIELFIDCEKISPSKKANELNAKNKLSRSLRPIQQSSKGSCYNFLFKKTEEQLSNRGLYVAYIEQIEDVNQSVLIRDAVLSVMTYMEEIKTKFSLEKILENEKFWNDLDSYTPVVEKYQPESEFEIDRTLVESIKKDQDLVRKKLVLKVIENVYNYLLKYSYQKVQGKEYRDTIVISPDCWVDIREALTELEKNRQHYEDYLKKMKNELDKSPIKKTCFYYLLRESEAELQRRKIRLMYIDRTAECYKPSTLLMYLVDDVMRELERNSAVLTDESLWGDVFRNPDYQAPVEKTENSSCILL